MTVPEYIRHPLFKVHGASLKQGIGGQPFWLNGDELPQFFENLDRDDVMLISHNALFDACITAWEYGFVPRLTGDTLGIARAMLGHKLKSLSLGSVAQHLEVGIKGTTIHQVQGMTVADIKANGLWDAYVNYAINDVEQCANIWKELVVQRKFPAKELVLMDRIIRCATEPALVLDQNVLHEHLAMVKATKDALMERIGFSKEDLMSNEKFAAALTTLGVTPPRKISPTTGMEAWAFAKTDPAFVELEDHPDPAVQALVAARMGVKTTLEEKRTERFIALSNLSYMVAPDVVDVGLMPIPLRYSGAHTHRLSGEWKLNLQNLPRGGALRKALAAPHGSVVLAVDSSQIEARINAWLGGEEELLEAFRQGRDVYSEFASVVFGYPVNKSMKKERFIGKTCILGLGYGMGWQKFQQAIKIQSRAQLGEEISLSDTEAMGIVQTYRNTYRGIAQSWRELSDKGLPALMNGGGFSIGPCEFLKERVTLPSGLHLHYFDLEQKEDGYHYKYGGMPKRTYGSKLLENVTQALARIAVMDAALAIDRRVNDNGLNAQLVLQVHDELVYVVQNTAEQVAHLRTIATKEMAKPPIWAPDLPLASECETGANYGEAK
jgi:DNA polymerase